MNLFGLDLFSLIVALISVFLAGIIRGYSGFGFAMVAVTSISLVLPPIHVVPLVLILEVLASIKLVPQVWKDIDWHSLRWLLAGSLLATPIGVYLLANVPAEPMRISISLMVLVAAMLLLYGWAWRRMPGRPLILTTGVTSGILNGAAFTIHSAIHAARPDVLSAALVFVGTSVVTLGISVVAKGMLDRVTAEKKVCEQALEEIGRGTKGSSKKSKRKK